MRLDHVDAIANAVLYEGYILYPYRPSSLKNQQRWTFGAVFPRDYAEVEGGDPWVMQTQCLVRGQNGTPIEIRARFLHFIRRQIGRLPAPVTVLSDNPDFTVVASIEVGDQMLIPWDEAVVRDVVVPVATLGALADGVNVPIGIARSHVIEPVHEDGKVIGVIDRIAAALTGGIHIGAEALDSDVWRLTVRIENTTPLPDEGHASRDAAQRFAFASLHTVLGVKDGAFISLTDPPDDLANAAAACENQGTWPVLVGQEGDTDTVLSSPIILPDYPEIAPESPGELFDGCEIDEILTLRILTMTDAEKREMAATDPRAKAMLERSEALTHEDFERMHGIIRQPRAVDTKPRLATIHVDGRAITVGDRVRLKPKPGGDIFDLVLGGMVAIIEGIETDFEDRIHIAVTIAEDPGREFGTDKFPGHRFFYSVDEIEPIEEEEAA
jgi:hydrogenase maturation protease